MSPLSAKCWRPGLAFLIVGLVVIALFYAEENWRGRRTWENCKREVRARGVDPNWANYVPTPVPDKENIFGVPEMQKWFSLAGAGWADLAGKLSAQSYPGLNIDSNSARMVVARLTVGLPGTPAPNGFVTLRWNDPASRAEAAKLLGDALGPIARAPQSPIGVGLMVRKPGEVRPAEIFLQGETAPTEKDLQEFLPDTVVQANTGLPERVLKFESDGDGSYQVTMPVLAKAADFLAWSDGLESQFALIRQALQRPASQLLGYYGNPDRIPTLSFRPIRNLAQTLGARSQCHLLLGQPDEAFRDLTLVHDFCRRVLEEEKPMTLLGAMVNVALRGLYAGEIAEGLRLHAWREPQLAALEGQLKTIDIVPPVKQAFFMEATRNFGVLESVPSAGLVKRSVLSGLCPRGWGYQRMAARVRLDFDRLATLDTGDRVIFADKVQAADRKSQALQNGWFYTFAPSLESTVFAKACQRTAFNQIRIKQALIACALERYHFARGEYPENLDALVPQFADEIPRDLIGGRPFHYRRDTDGTFVLYSVGWNERDDGGARSQVEAGADGDWVWP